MSAAAASAHPAARSRAACAPGVAPPPMPRSGQPRAATFSFICRPNASSGRVGSYTTTALVGSDAASDASSAAACGASMYTSTHSSTTSEGALRG
jgi:hypothetical protein